MHPATVVATFATIFVAELPDKTMLATIVLSARFKRPFAVWVGAAIALTAQMVIAVTAGRLLELLPERPVRVAVAVLFAVGAIVLWRSSDEVLPDEAEVERERRSGAGPPLPAWRISATVFGVVFVAEWGDLTQLATASLASARRGAVGVRRGDRGDGDGGRDRCRRRSVAAARAAGAQPPPGRGSDLRHARRHRGSSASWLMSAIDRGPARTGDSTGQAMLQSAQWP